MQDDVELTYQNTTSIKTVKNVKNLFGVDVGE